MSFLVWTLCRRGAPTYVLYGVGIVKIVNVFFSLPLKNLRVIFFYLYWNKKSLALFLDSFLGLIGRFHKLSNNINGNGLIRKTVIWLRRFEVFSFSQFGGQFGERATAGFVIIRIEISIKLFRLSTLCLIYLYIRNFVRVIRLVTFYWSYNLINIYIIEMLYLVKVSSFVLFLFP